MKQFYRRLIAFAVGLGIFGSIAFGGSLLQTATSKVGTAHQNLDIHVTNSI